MSEMRDGDLFIELLSKEVRDLRDWKAKAQKTAECASENTESLSRENQKLRDEIAALKADLARLKELALLAQRAGATEFSTPHSRLKELFEKYGPKLEHFPGTP